MTSIASHAARPTRAALDLAPGILTRFLSSYNGAALGEISAFLAGASADPAPAHATLAEAIEDALLSATHTPGGHKKGALARLDEADEAFLGAGIARRLARLSDEGRVDLSREFLVALKSELQAGADLRIHGGQVRIDAGRVALLSD